VYSDLPSEGDIEQWLRKNTLNMVIFFLPAAKDLSEIALLLSKEQRYLKSKLQSAGVFGGE
jgi:hypothetical protein